MKFQQIFFVGLVVWPATTYAAGREIPLSEMYSTREQEGLHRVHEGRHNSGEFVELFGADLEEIRSRSAGASNAFLVDVANIGDAVGASRRVLCGYAPADSPARRSSKKAGEYWLTVYLGGGHSSPIKYIVDNATVSGNTIRFNYRKPHVGFQTEDIVRYYYWLPIGTLDDGAYNVELYDAEVNAVTLMRRVEVKAR